MSDGHNARNDHERNAARFKDTAERFCHIVDSASGFGGVEILFRIYQILPTLIGEAVQLPDVELTDDQNPNRLETPGKQEQWKKLYDLLKVKLGDADLYWQVFDPTKHSEPIHGTLADDIADIYGDLKEGLTLLDDCSGTTAEAIWTWRTLFLSHWGDHAMNGLRTIHHLLSERLGDGELT